MNGDLAKKHGIWFMDVCFFFNMFIVFESQKILDDDIEQSKSSFMGKATDAIAWVGKLHCGVIRWWMTGRKSRSEPAWMGRVSFAEGRLYSKASR